MVEVRTRLRKCSVLSAQALNSSTSVLNSSAQALHPGVQEPNSSATQRCTSTELRAQKRTLKRTHRTFIEDSVHDWCELDVHQYISCTRVVGTRTSRDETRTCSDTRTRKAARRTSFFREKKSTNSPVDNDNFLEYVETRAVRIAKRTNLVTRTNQRTEDHRQTNAFPTHPPRIRCK